MFTVHMDTGLEGVVLHLPAVSHTPIVSGYLLSVVVKYILKQAALIDKHMKHIALQP